MDKCLVVLTAVKSAPKKPCSMPDQKVRGMTSSWLGSFMCLHNSIQDGNTDIILHFLTVSRDQQF